MLRINPDGGFAIGVNITPIGVNAALIDLSGDVVASLRSRGRQRVARGGLRDHRRDGAEADQAASRRAACLASAWRCPVRSASSSMSFVGPTTMTGWENVAIRERLAELTGLPAFLETDMAAAALGEQLYGLGKHFSEYYYLYFGVGLGGALVHEGRRDARRLGQCRRNRPHPRRARRRAVPVRQSRLPGALCFARCPIAAPRRARQIGSRPWRRSSATRSPRSRTCSIRRRWCSAAWHRPTCSIAWRGWRADLPNSIAARRGRETPRVVVARGGEHSVLRGAAALAVSGVLSPRFGRMFTGERERDILARQGRSPHERRRCSCSKTSARTSARSKR